MWPTGNGTSAPKNKKQTKYLLLPFSLTDVAVLIASKYSFYGSLLV